MASSIRRRLALALGIATASSVAFPSLPAQSQGFVQATVKGTVETPGKSKLDPVPGIMVTLHRVAEDSSGPVDSVRTDAAGRYAFRYQKRQGDEGVFFAAAVYRGIAYFSAPLRQLTASGDDGVITVFDTTRHAIEFSVRGHHIVVSGPRPDGDRDVVEVWELSNDTTVTVLGVDSLAAVWSAPLPAGATNFAGGQGDVAADAIVARRGRAEITSPFGPGVKQISYTYRLPSSSFPLAVGITAAVSVLEVLVEEPTAVVTGGELRSVAAATTGGRTFKRFLAQDVAAGESVRITVPAATAETRKKVLIVLAAVMIVLMAGALFRALRRRDTENADPRARTPSTADELLAEIAVLDARFEGGDASLDRETYDAQRAALKLRVTSALARRTTAG
ncbi:MAG: hypothetical protein V4550_12890 [Gemmatimonadota bacterium]